MRLRGAEGRVLSGIRGDRSLIVIEWDAGFASFVRQGVGRSDDC